MRRLRRGCGRLRGRGSLWAGRGFSDLRGGFGVSYRSRTSAHMTEQPQDEHPPASEGVDYRDVRLAEVEAELAGSPL